MGAPARAFWLTLLAYVVIGGILIAWTGGPTAPPSESTAGNATAPSNATSGNVTTANATAGGASAGPTAENFTSPT